MQVAQLLVYHQLCLLGTLHGLCLKGLNGLDLAVDIVRLGLESIEASLDFIDDGRVLEYTAVVREVDCLRLLGQNRHLAARIVIALLERLQSGSSLTFETELRADLGPVKLEGGAAL